MREYRMARRFETITAGGNDDGRRIDAVLRRALPRLPLSRIYRALRAGDIRLEGSRVKPGTRVGAGAAIEVSARLLADGAAGEGPAVDPAPVHAMVVARTGHLLVLNKPAGIPVQGGSNLGTQPLDEMVRAYLAGSGERSLSFRPGPLHRLDRNTSGLVVFSVSLEGARHFSDALRSGRLRKYYLALLGGRLTDTEVWSEPLVRDEPRRLTRVSTGASAEQSTALAAETRATPLLVGRDATLALCRLITGRAHQIRAHAAAHGHSLPGDRKYGGAGSDGYLLHAFRMELVPPDPLLGDLSCSAPLGAGQREQVSTLLGLSGRELQGRDVNAALSRSAIETAVRRLDSAAP